MNKILFIIKSIYLFLNYILIQKVDEVDKIYFINKRSQFYKTPHPFNEGFHYIPLKKEPKDIQDAIFINKIYNKLASNRIKGVLFENSRICQMEDHLAMNAMYSLKNGKKEGVVVKYHINNSNINLLKAYIQTLKESI